jgi:hypothetical protein
MGFDDFRMKRTTFAPHPHAGFAAITYIYEDSISGMRDRDSLGNDVIAGPGDLLCTVAGRGVIHDELPSVEGREVNGLQLFINLHSKHKQISPELIHIKASDVPSHTDTSGNRTRVLAGEFGRKQGLLKLPEPCLFLDVRLAAKFEFSVQPGWNALVYALRGATEAAVGEGGRSLAEAQAFGIRAENEGERVILTPNTHAEVLIVSGPAWNEEVVAYGPFIMAEQSQIQAAIREYQTGGMGHLGPLS